MSHWAQNPRCSWEMLVVSVLCLIFKETAFIIVQVEMTIPRNDQYHPKAIPFKDSDNCLNRRVDWLALIPSWCLISSKFSRFYISLIFHKVGRTYPFQNGVPLTYGWSNSRFRWWGRGNSWSSASINWFIVCQHMVSEDSFSITSLMPHRCIKLCKPVCVENLIKLVEEHIPIRYWWF